MSRVSPPIHVYIEAPYGSCRPPWGMRVFLHMRFGWRDFASGDFASGDDRPWSIWGCDGPIWIARRPGIGVFINSQMSGVKLPYVRGEFPICPGFSLQMSGVKPLYPLTPIPYMGLFFCVTPNLRQECGAVLIGNYRKL